MLTLRRVQRLVFQQVPQASCQQCCARQLATGPQDKANDPSIDPFQAKMTQKAEEDLAALIKNVPKASGDGDSDWVDVCSRPACSTLQGRLGSLLRLMLVACSSALLFHCYSVQREMSVTARSSSSAPGQLCIVLPCQGGLRGFHHPEECIGAVERACALTGERLQVRNAATGEIGGSQPSRDGAEPTRFGAPPPCKGVW